MRSAEYFEINPEKPQMKLTCLEVFLVSALVFSASIAEAATFTFALPGKDGRSIQLDTPKGWTASQTSEITISVDDSGGKPMSFLISALAVPAVIRSPLTAKDIAEEQAMMFSAGSEIPTLPVKVFEDKALGGAYFDAVDKAPKPGEFKYLRHFVVELDGVMVHATVLSNAGHNAINANALKVVESIRIVKLTEI
jgi:hypothetical protein